MKPLDRDWLLSQAADEASRKTLREILAGRERVARTNTFLSGNEPFPLRLRGYTLWFRMSSAFSSIEIFGEVFGEDGRFSIDGFGGEDARTILDVGANAGYYALRMKERNAGCAIYCVEPNPHVFEILERNIRSNALENVVLANKCMAGSNGKMIFEYVPEIDAIGGRGLRTVARGWMREEFIRKAEVESVTLVDFCRERGVGSVDILKVDTEGMEAEIFQGGLAVLPRVRKIVVERHSASLRHAVNDILTAQGFSLVFEEDPEFTRYYGEMFYIRGVA